MDTPQPPRTSALASPLVLTLAALGVLALGGTFIYALQAGGGSEQLGAASLKSGDGSTQVITCTGKKPTSGVTTCPGDGGNGSQTWTPVADAPSCTTANKCEYYCQVGWPDTGTPPVCRKATGLTVTPESTSVPPDATVTLTASALYAQRYDFRRVTVSSGANCTTVTYGPVATSQSTGTMLYTSPPAGKKICVKVYASSQPVNGPGCTLASCWDGPVYASITSSNTQSS